MHGYRIKEARFRYLVKVVIKCVVSNQRMWSKENPFFLVSFFSSVKCKRVFGLILPFKLSAVLGTLSWYYIRQLYSWLFWMPWISHHKSEYTFMTEWISLVRIWAVFFIVCINVYVKKMKSTPTPNLKLSRVLLGRCTRQKKKLCSNKI